MTDIFAPGKFVPLFAGDYVVDANAVEGLDARIAAGGGGGGIDETAVDARITLQLVNYRTAAEITAEIGMAIAAIPPPTAQVEFVESQYDTYIVGGSTDALYGINFTNYQFDRIGNASAFTANEDDPRGIAWHEGALYLIGGRRKLIRLNTTDGTGESIGADNSLPDGVQGLISLNGVLIAAVDDPHSTAISLIDINPADGSFSNSRALTGAQNIADITLSPTGELFGVCGIGGVFNLVRIPDTGGAVMPVGAFRVGGTNRAVYTLFYRGFSLFAISDDIGDDDIFAVNINTAEMRELGENDFFGVSELLPRGAVSVQHYRTLPQAATWAERDNDEQIPNNKLPRWSANLLDGTEGRTAITDTELNAVRTLPEMEDAQIVRVVAAATNGTYRLGDDIIDRESDANSHQINNNTIDVIFSFPSATQIRADYLGGALFAAIIAVYAYK